MCYKRDVCLSFYFYFAECFEVQFDFEEISVMIRNPRFIKVVVNWAIAMDLQLLNFDMQVM